MTEVENSFWTKCVSYGVVVVPFKAYRFYNDKGNLDESDCIGMKFVCLEAGDLVAVCKGGDFYLQVESAVSVMKIVADTPEAALEAYIADKTSHQALK